MNIDCPSCSRKVALDQAYPYHAGLSNQGFLYCDRDSAVLIFSAYDPTYVKIVGDIHPWMLAPNQKALLEVHLKAGPCGGTFSFENPPRCPQSSESLHTALPSHIHYVILGRLIDGDHEPIWNDLEAGM